MSPGAEMADDAARDVQKWKLSESGKLLTAAGAADQAGGWMCALKCSVSNRSRYLHALCRRIMARDGDVDVRRESLRAD